MSMAYQTDIVQCDGSFCDENCRSWMDIEWNQHEIGEFCLDSSKASVQVVNLHQQWALVFASDDGCENLWNQAKCAALFTELSCAIRTEELLFS